jgi:hypothetical protein
MTKKEEFKVTPWDVSGKVDYDKLIREFGVSKIDEKSSKTNVISKKCRKQIRRENQIR